MLEEQTQQGQARAKQVIIPNPRGLNVLESDRVDVLAGLVPVFDDTGQVKPPQVETQLSP